MYSKCHSKETRVSLHRSKEYTPEHETKSERNIEVRRAGNLECSFRKDRDRPHNISYA
jgi:hypothetical protein